MKLAEKPEKKNGRWVKLQATQSHEGEENGQGHSHALVVALQILQGLEWPKWTSQKKTYLKTNQYLCYLCINYIPKCLMVATQKVDVWIPIKSAPHQPSTIIYPLLN